MGNYFSGNIRGLSNPPSSRADCHYAHPDRNQGSDPYLEKQQRQSNPKTENSQGPVDISQDLVGLCLGLSMDDKSPFVECASIDKWQRQEAGCQDEAMS